MYNAFDFIDRFDTLVDSIRESNSFTAIQNGSIWNVTAQNSLFENDFITVLDIDYQIQNVTASGFDIEIDSFPGEGIYKAKAPYFMYDNALVINNRLLSKNKDEVYKYQKYPLIALNLPFDIEKGHIPIADMNIAFLSFTKVSYTTVEKRQNVFELKLIPLYDSFLKNLKERSEFILESWNYKERMIPFYGSDIVGKHIFNDPLDGIELKNLKLRIKN